MRAADKRELQPIDPAFQPIADRPAAAHFPAAPVPSGPTDRNSSAPAARRADSAVLSDRESANLAAQLPYRGIADGSSRTSCAISAALHRHSTPPFHAPIPQPRLPEIIIASAGSASMCRSPPASTLASMSAARFRGKNTTMSPLPEVSCDTPARCTTPPPVAGESGLIHARILPPAVAARTVPATRVKQILPALDSTSIGPDDIHDANSAAARLCPHRAANFSEIDLPAAGSHAHQIAGLTDRNISAVCLEIGAPRNLFRANVSAAAVQRRIARDVAHIDVPARGERVQISADVEHLNVSAFGLQPRYLPTRAGIAHKTRPDAPRA